MEENNCTSCKNTNCIFKLSLSEYKKIEIEFFNIQSDSTIFLESMPVKGLYIVQKGCINEYHTDKKGQKKICHTAKSGEIFGHKDFNAVKHLFSAVAAENSSICLINKSNLLEICRNNPEQSIELINFFSEKLNQSDQRYYLTLKNI